MNKIKSIKFFEHPVLGNIKLDFTLPSGKVADCILIAGINGTGKSQILSAIHRRFSSILSNSMPPSEFCIITENGELTIKQVTSQSFVNIYKDGNYAGQTHTNNFITTNKLSAILSSVAINFNSGRIENVTSLDVDKRTGSIASGEETPMVIEQLFIDINNLDALEFRDAYERARRDGGDLSKINAYSRMERFTKAFSSIFDSLKFKRISNVNGAKDIIFERHNTEFSIKALSSGEKQIVYRGGFMLQNINSTRGAFVLLDEPETTLHPEWQKKILSFYRNIFRDAAGQQTSQIFVVTHSPFIMHSNDKANTKILILQRNDEGKIIVQDSPEYYSCDSIKAIEDAFNIRDFSDVKPTIYLEGRTDVRYFRKALELSGTADFPFDFKWVGHIDANGQEANTGKDALNKAFQFLISQNPTKLNICLSDCDTKVQTKKRGNVLSMALPQFENNPAGITKGIENALCVSKDFFDGFVKTIEKIDGYGLTSIRPEPDKMKMCDTICDSLEPKVQREILANLITQLENFKQLYTEHVEAVTSTANV